MEQSTDEYVSGVTEQSIIQLHEQVTELKKWRELEARFMTGEELMQQRERKGRQAGLAEGKVQGRAEGKAEGKADSIFELLEDCGTVPESLREQIYAQKDTEVLTRWHKLSARVQSVQEFMEQM